jgi:hypothetical protein
LRPKSTCLLVSAGLGLAVVLSQPSTAQAQTPPNLVIASSHSGNFTVGVNGIYILVVSNIGATTSGIQVDVSDPIRRIGARDHLGGASERQRDREQCRESVCM